MIKLSYSIFRNMVLTNGLKYNKGTNKLNDLIAQLSERITEQPASKNSTQEEILKNYVELTQQSYVQHLRQQQKIIQAQKKKIDPRLILMIIPTLQKQQSIREHLLLIFAFLNFLNIKELQLFYEYLLTYKINTKPKVPSPRSLIGGEALLTLLAEIYPKDNLIQWLGQVPLYSGQQSYLISMGAFSIISQLSQSAKTKNQSIINRSLQRIFELWSASSGQKRLGVILLALQAKMPFSQLLIFQQYSLELEQIDGLKIGLLFIQLNSYIQSEYKDVKSVGGKRYQKQEQQGIEIKEELDRIPAKNNNPANQKYVYNPQKPQQVKYQLQVVLKKVLRNYLGLQWKNVVKLHQMIKFYHIIKSKPLQKEWLRFANKLFDFTARKEQISTLINLSTQQIIQIVQCLEKHKVDKPVLLKQLLVALSDRLQVAQAKQLIRLAKCLITYVRLCEDYLIHFRQILERRKYIFSPEDIDALNFLFRRVHILFPKPLLY